MSLRTHHLTLVISFTVVTSCQAIETEPPSDRPARVDAAPRVYGGASTATEVASEKCYDAIAIAEAANERFRAHIVATTKAEEMCIEVFVAGNSYGFFRSIDFTIDLPTYRPQGIRDEPAVVAYWLNDHTLRIGPHWPTSAANFFEVRIPREDGEFPRGLMLTPGVVVAHAPTVLDVVEPYLLVQRSYEGILEIQLVHSESGRILASTSDFDFRLFPRSAKLSLDGGTLNAHSACRIDDREPGSEVAFHQVFRCDCAPGNCRRPFTYELDLSR